MPIRNGNILSRFAAVLLGCAIITLAAPERGYGQTTNDSETEAAAADKTDGAMFLEEVSAYLITFDENARKIDLLDSAVLNWSNPISNDQVGAVFVWMSGGRPQTIGCCFHQSGGGRIQELHSLATEPLRAQREGKEIWHPREFLKFSPIPGAIAPATTPQARLLQMRRISRRFSAQMTREDGNQTQLRLISRPVLHYQPGKKPCTDGAIFSFAAGGTDPDAFLLIENHDIDGQPTWVYSFARFHFAALSAQLDGNDVWSVDAKPRLASNYLGSKTYRNDAYIVFRTY